VKSLLEKDMSEKEQDKGTYILLTKLAKTQKIKPGKLPEADYKKGTYLYVGRAQTGLRARIKRHIFFISPLALKALNPCEMK
jgi:hypothetical protein